ncbi:MAG: hypothetical protein SV186_03305 [Candidatus Nanohaloarchaea archaeon]|nr:hypothetical protein [Candidatus Nanohaloarchaea archaeon]
MSVAAEPDGPEEAAYNARTALDQAQEYAELVADYAQMKYMHEGGEAEEQYLSRLVEDEQLPYGDDYDPERIEGWVEEPEKKEEVLELYEERIEEFLDEEADMLQRTLRVASTSKKQADAADELEASEHRYYGDQDVDPSTVKDELSRANTLVNETDSYTSNVFGAEVKERTTALARSTSFQGFDPTDV